MGSLFDDAERKRIKERIQTLGSEDQAQFGTMNPREVVCHLIDSLRAPFDPATAEVFEPSFFSTKLGQWFVISSPVPWPKGKIKIKPEMEKFFFKSKPSEDFEHDKQTLLDAVEAFAENKNETFSPSPVFGKLSPERWSKLQHRHLDHHLSQFGK